MDSGCLSGDRLINFGRALLSSAFRNQRIFNCASKESSFYRRENKKKQGQLNYRAGPKKKRIRRIDYVTRRERRRRKKKKTGS